jgi:hypothetical protein
LYCTFLIISFREIPEYEIYGSEEEVGIMADAESRRKGFGCKVD